MLHSRTLAEKQLFPRYCAIPKTGVLRLSSILGMFLAFGRFQTHVLIKTILIKKNLFYCFLQLAKVGHLIGILSVGPSEILALSVISTHHGDVK